MMYNVEKCFYTRVNITKIFKNSVNFDYSKNTNIIPQILPATQHCLMLLSRNHFKRKNRTVEEQRLHTGSFS